VICFRYTFLKSPKKFINDDYDDDDDDDDDNNNNNNKTLKQIGKL